MILHDDLGNVLPLTAEDEATYRAGNRQEP